jgi:hypothetical protein
VLRRPAASPALSSLTPALAAVVAPTNTPPRPIEAMTRPGRMSETYEPSTGIRDSQ